MWVKVKALWAEFWGFLKSPYLKEDVEIAEKVAEEALAAASMVAVVVPEIAPQVATATAVVRTGERVVSVVIEKANSTEEGGKSA